MSGVTVFVDDAVQGRLPMVCVSSGAPADGLHPIHTPIGGSSGWLWLLIFLGPIGWVALVAVSLGSRSRDLVVRLPYSRTALARERAAFRAAVIAGIVLVAGGIATVALINASHHNHGYEGLVVVTAAATLVALLAALAFGVRYSLARPRIDLDASGRWVNLGNVHPNFAEACTQRQAAARAESGTRTR